MHQAFRPCAVVEIPKERIEVIFAYGRSAARTATDDRRQTACGDIERDITNIHSSGTKR